MAREHPFLPDGEHPDSPRQHGPLHFLSLHVHFPAECFIAVSAGGVCMWRGGGGGLNTTISSNFVRKQPGPWHNKSPLTAGLSCSSMQHHRPCMGSRDSNEKVAKAGTPFQKVDGLTSCCKLLVASGQLLSGSGIPGAQVCSRDSLEPDASADSAGGQPYDMSVLPWPGPVIPSSTVSNSACAFVKMSGLPGRC